MKKYHDFKLIDLESLLQLKSWWALIAVLPIANRLAIFFANFTRITPNSITLSAALFRIASGIFFLKGAFFVGAASFYVAYTLDCVDGPLARLTQQSSEMGRYLDHLSDLIGDIFILACLAQSQHMLFSNMIIAMIFIHIAECYISYLSGFAIDKTTVTAQTSPVLFVRFNRYRNWWFSRNMKSFFSFPDYAAFIFILAPLLGFPGAGLYIGFWIVITTTLYTVLSTFASIHSGIKSFP